MSIRKIHTTVELADGTIHGPHRITAQDQWQWEITSAANGWRAEVSAYKGNTFLSWHALTRLGLVHSTFDDFRSHELVDLEIKRDEESEGEAFTPPAV